MKYTITVSQGGKHFFTTSTPFTGNAQGIVKEFLKRFPAKESFHVGLTVWIEEGHPGSIKHFLKTGEWEERPKPKPVVCYDCMELGSLCKDHAFGISKKSKTPLRKAR